MDSKDKEYIDAQIESVKVYVNSRLGEYQKGLVDTLNQYNDYIGKRFDDTDQALDKIVSSLGSVHRNTKLIPDIFELLESDGTDIAQLSLRVDKIEGSRSSKN